MTRLFLVRHGPTHAKSMVGWSDIPADLSDKDALQRLSDYLPSNAIVISSDLSRAAATADAIENGRQRLPHNPDLREINFGDWELQRFDAIQDQKALRAYWDNPGATRPPNGESWNEVVARVNGAVDALVAEHQNQPLIIVAHFGVILTQYQRAAAISAYEAFGQRIDNLSVTELALENGTWSLGAINHRP